MKILTSSCIRKLGIVLIIALVSVACGAGGEGATDSPDLIQPAASDGATDSPRGDATPEPGLPPTWTPAAQPGDGHVFDVRGEQAPEVEITGTRTIYVVQRGDTLGEIATRFGVSVADLASINNIDNINIIEVGDELIIP